MAGIKITKNYVSTSISNTNLANNWMVLVYGVTSQGSTKPTLVQNYSTFIDIFGQPVSGVLTHAYMRFLLDSGVPVLFYIFLVFSFEQHNNFCIIRINQIHIYLDQFQICILQL